MYEVHVSGQARDKISELEFYLQEGMKFSKIVARKRSDRMRVFLKSLNAAVDYARATSNNGRHSATDALCLKKVGCLLTKLSMAE